MRLAAPAATWELDVDVVVLGSGAAGLSAALAVRPVRSVLVVTKDILSAGSTQESQQACLFKNGYHFINK